MAKSSSPFGAGPFEHGYYHAVLLGQIQFSGRAFIKLAAYAVSALASV